MSTPRSVAFHTLGCKLNYAETSSISRLFTDAGYSVVPFDQIADIYVINTCSVTDFADRKCRKAVRQILKRSAHARIVMMGCYAQLKPKEIANIPGVNLVLGAGEKFRILEYIEQLKETFPVNGHIAVSPIDTAKEFYQSFSIGDRTRTFLKIQDGCDYNCSFCTIPLARGKSRSNQIDHIVEQASKIVASGIKEIVLTGVNTGDFGKYYIKSTKKFQRKTHFLNLLQALEKVKGLTRLRISSIEPNLCHNEIIEWVAHSTKIVPHFHLPLQSGNDYLLKQMRRRYDTQLYQRRVEKIKEIIPDACIGVDVIVGFPGETEDHFLETYRFLQNLEISYLHVFTYSERPGTPADDLDSKVPMDVRRERNKMLTILSDKKKRHFYQSFNKQTRKVLLEQSKIPQFLTGYTDNYLKVNIPKGTYRENTLIDVKLDHLSPDCIFNGIPAVSEFSG